MSVKVFCLSCFPLSARNNNTSITQVKHTKFLGVIIDEQLKWIEHINSVANKISKITGVLCKARHFVSRSLLRSLYYSLIYPYIFYGNIVWANAYHCHLEKIYKLQKKIVRILTFKEYNHPSKSLFEEMEILVVGKWGFWLIDLGNFQNLDNFHF